MRRIFGLIAAVGALLIFAPVAAAQTATTAGAINVTSTSATLVGYLNPGAPTYVAYSFEYGTTTSYGQLTPAQAAPTGNGMTEVTANVTGLSPNTTYHFQLIGARTVSQPTPTPIFDVGGDQSFTTASTGSGSGSGASGKGSLRLVGKTLQVNHGKVLVALWCLGTHACRGTFSISSSGKSCVKSKSVSLGATKVKAFNVSLRAACKTLMRKASRHTVHGKLKATLSTGQPTFSSKVTLTPRP